MEDEGYLDSREKLDIQYRNYNYDHAAKRGGLSWFTNKFIKFFQNYFGGITDTQKKKCCIGQWYGWFYSAY